MPRPAGIKADEVNVRIANVVVGRLRDEGWIVVSDWGDGFSCSWNDKSKNNYELIKLDRGYIPQM